MKDAEVRRARVGGPRPEEPTTPSSAEEARDIEQQVRAKLRPALRRVLRAPRLKAPEKEDRLADLLDEALGSVGRFYRLDNRAPIFFRHSERKLYDLDGRPESPFGRLVTYLGDVSVRTAPITRCIDRLRAEVGETAKTVQVHALAYNSPDTEVIAVNDFGGGMWVRRRLGLWQWKPNGSDGVLFWTPAEFVESWAPEFGPDSDADEAHLQWLLEQAHFADDILTAQDQRMLFRTCLLAPMFPALCRTRPVQAHLGLPHQRQHDTGKTMAGKIIGCLLVGSQFLPTPVTRSGDRGEENLQLALVNQPFVLLDNVDTEIPWLNEFLCTYATGARPIRRKHYENTTLVYYEYRGRVCVTSRKAKFNRADVASRTIPFRFRPISDEERKTEAEILDPLLKRRGPVWGGLLAAVARVQDALPALPNPPISIRLADFEALGWRVAKVYGEAKDWEAAMHRLDAAQAGFALEDEPLFAILARFLEDGDLPEQPTSEFYEKTVGPTAEALGLVGPSSAAACTKRLNELRELLEARLDVKIHARTLQGQTLVRVARGPSWER